MYKKVELKHIDKRTKVIKGLNFPFKEGIYYENVEIPVLLDMLDIMNFKAETLKAKHKSNPKYMKHRYIILDLQTSIYREEICDTIGWCLWILDPYVIGCKFFEEDGDWYE